MTTPIIIEDFLIDEEPEEQEPVGSPLSPPKGRPIVIEDFLIDEPQRSSEPVEPKEKSLSAAPPTAESTLPPSPPAGETGAVPSPAPVEPSFMGRIGDAAGAVVEHFRPESPMDLVAGALDAVGWASQPLEQFSEGIVRGLTFQDQGTYGERVEGFRERPWWQQLAIGAVTDPTAAIGAVGRGGRVARQAVRQAPEIAEEVAEQAPDVLRQGSPELVEVADEPLARLPIIEDVEPPAGGLPEIEDADIFATLERGRANRRLANQFLEEQVIPEFHRRFGDVPMMSVKPGPNNQVFLEINSAGWRDQALDIGLELVDDAGLSDLYRIPGIGGEALPPPVGTVPEIEDALPLIEDIVEEAPGPRILAAARTPQESRQIIEEGIARGTIDKWSLFRPTQVVEAARVGVPRETVNKLITLISEAKPVRAETEALRTAERRRRVAISSRILEQGEGHQAFVQARRAQAGPLPSADFSPPDVGLSSDEITSMYNSIRDADLPYYKKDNTDTALTSLLAGNIPRRFEIALLENHFGPELAESILSKRTLGAKVMETALDALNIPRALNTTWDASAPLRQGILLAPGHPKEFFGAFGTMMKSMVKEKNAVFVDDWITHHPNFERFQEAGLYHASRTGVAIRLGEREEAYMSRLASWIPGVRIAERGYVTFLNKQRFDVMNTIYEGWRKAGKEPSMADMQSLARFINAATGRGSMPQWLQRYGPALNATFFSPRLQISRIQAPLELARGTGSILEAFGRNPRTRGLVARDLAAFVGTGIGVMALLKGAGAPIEGDARSSDYGKIRFGNVRLDFWGSFQPIARYIAQYAKGQKKDLGTGRLEKYERGTTAKNFLRSKMSPLAGFIWDYMQGYTYGRSDFSESETQFGYEVPGAAVTLIDTFMPFFLRDLAEAIELEGLRGGFVAVPAFFGAGGLTFTPDDDLEEARQERIRGAAAQGGPLGGIGETFFGEPVPSGPAMPTLPEIEDAPTGGSSGGTPTRRRSNMWQMP